ncbi:BfmA/BtgA family mobilization protein [Flagellimonas lutimaris]|uniref:BfmA/BtgA family mobilization protein n=1 Tax=Flagellimonas lutimaris TaxID=475082 RepID=UPI001601CCF2|nr:BfmA/BtgA family mobilization protein [Allomuricauda lutimaris]
MGTDSFSNIRFKKDTAKRFQSFSRMYYKTHTLALAGMLDFFKYNEISPHESLGKRMGLIMDFLQKFRDFTAKRNNATIAIIKDLEKHGVLPTKAMMELLFEGDATSTTKKSKGGEIEELVIPEIQGMDLDTEFALLEERKQRQLLEQELAQLKTMINEQLLNRVKVIRPALGTPRLQLEMTLSEWKDFQEHFKTP